MFWCFIDEGVYVQQLGLCCKWKSLCFRYVLLNMCSIYVSHSIWFIVVVKGLQIILYFHICEDG